MADGGTLYLDEVADMPLSTQARILRVLTEQPSCAWAAPPDRRRCASGFLDLAQSRKGNRRTPVSARTCSTGSTWCRWSCRRWRERREDIPALVDHFFTRYRQRAGRAAARRSASEAMAALQAYEWPGNVRQLRNVVERTVILTPREEAGPDRGDMLPPEVVSGRLKRAIQGMSALMGVPLREARENFEREYLRVQIRRFSGNISKTAAFIGMERSALHRKLKLLGMADREDDEGGDD
jgi:two-component system nitrogen regulation response regulator NtrX